MAKRTPLYDTHTKAGAKLIEFGGWDMPVQYSSVLEEHKAVRNRAGMFDLSHMGELLISGVDALSALQGVTTNDLSQLEVGQAQYNLLCRPDGGIVDDVLIYRRPGDYYVVVNAANIEKDVNWLKTHLQGQATLTDLSSETALIAVQGPLSGRIIQAVVSENISQLYAFEFMECTAAGIKAMISRTGYTGEDGFELYFSAEAAPALWQALTKAGAPLGMLPVGLGARDTLRLEARLTLYGNDIDDTTTPLEAGLSYFVKFDKGSFIGREALLAQKASGVQRRLVGFVVEGRGIPRHGYTLQSLEGENIGTVTSGSFAPSLEKDIGLGYVASQYAASGTRIQIDIRGKARPAEIVKGRFVESHTRRRD